MTRAAVVLASLSLAVCRVRDALYAQTMQCDPEDVAYVRQAERENRKDRKR